jgi:esterase/lipase
MYVMEDVILTVEGQKVAAKYFEPAEPIKKLALLFLHGWTGRPNEHAASFMASNGSPAMTIIMRGHPGSEGDIKTVTAKDSLQDAINAYDFLKSKITSDTKIVAVGNSYGGYISTLLSAERELAALSLRVPAGYPDDIFEQPKWGKGHEDSEVDAWRHTSVSFSENRAFGLIHKFPGQIQIIEAEEDAIVPSQTVKNYVDAVSDKSKLEYLLMKGWPHSLADHPERNQEFQTALLEWANKVESRV